MESRVTRMSTILTRSVSVRVEHPRGDVWKQLETKDGALRTANADLRVINKKMKDQSLSQ